MAIANLVPDGCVVETMDNIAVIHDGEGTLVAIISGTQHNTELARLIVELPGFMRSVDVALERGVMLPLARGMSILDNAVFQPQFLPVA